MSRMDSEKLVDHIEGLRNACQEVNKFVANNSLDHVVKEGSKYRKEYEGLGMANDAVNQQRVPALPKRGTTWNEPVRIALFGLPAAGKSFVINRMLQVDLVESRDGEEGVTKTPTLIKYGADKVKLSLIRAKHDFHGVSVIDDDYDRFSSDLKSLFDMELEEPEVLFEAKSMTQETIAQILSSKKRQEEHEDAVRNVRFVLEVPVKLLKSRGVEILDIPGHSECSTADQLRKGQTQFALHGAHVILSFDIAGRANGCTDTILLLHEHGWLHHRNVLPVFGVVANLKTLEIDIQNMEETFAKSRRLAQVALAQTYSLPLYDENGREERLERSQDSCVPMPHNDPVDCKKFLERVHVLSIRNELDRNDAQANTKNMSLLSDIDSRLIDMVYDFQLQNAKYQVLCLCRDIHRRAKYVVESFKNAKTSNSKELKKCIETMKMITSGKNAHTYSQKIKQWSKDWKAFVKETRSVLRAGFAEDPEDVQDFTESMKKLWDKLLEQVKNDAQLSSFYSPLKRILKAFDIDLNFKFGSNLPISETLVQNGELLDPLVSFENTSVEKDGKLSEIVKGLDGLLCNIEHELKRTRDRNDFDWRLLPIPKVHNNERTLQLPTKEFENLELARQAKCISHNDVFMKNKQQVKRLETPNTIDIIIDHGHDEPSQVEVDGHFQTRLTIELEGETVKVGGTRIQDIQNISDVVIQNATKCMHQTTDQPALFPIAVILDKDRNYRLHIAELISYLKSHPTSIENYSRFLLFLVHEDFDDDSSLEVQSKLQRLLREELKNVKAYFSHHTPSNTLPDEELINLSNENVVDFVVKGRGRSNEQIRTIVQLVMDKVLKTPYHFQIDTNIRFNEFYRREMGFFFGPHSCGRALAFMQRSMFAANNTITNEQHMQRIQDLKCFKTILDESEVAFADDSMEDTDDAVDDLITDFLESDKLPETAAKPDKLYKAVQPLTIAAKDANKYLKKSGHKQVLPAQNQDEMVPLTRLLQTILQKQRCAQVALADIDAQGMERNRMHLGSTLGPDAEGRELWPTSHVSMSREGVLLFNHVALEGLYYLGKSELFGNGRRTRQQTKFKNQFPRQLLLHGLGGLEVFQFMQEKVKFDEETWVTPKAMGKKRQKSDSAVTTPPAAASNKKRK